MGMSIIIEIMLTKVQGHRLKTGLSGSATAEMGPNMMWNTKYGMHSYPGGADVSNEISVGLEQAQRLAQRYLDANLPGVTVGEAESFYGYYTMHTIKDGEIDGMLSVNGYNGSVWYHSWHGPFIAMTEYHEEHES
jgi:hypothetical protein